MGVARLLEIAEHRLRGGMLHGQLVVRALPGFCFRRVARCARSRTNISGRRNCPRSERGRRFTLVGKEQYRGADCHGAHSDPTDKTHVPDGYF